MKAVDACYQLYKEIEKIVEEKLGYAKYDKTFRAKVIDQISETKYKVLYKNVEYLVTCDLKVKIGDIVWVCAPQNNWDNLYVQSQPDKTNDGTTVQVNGVKGSNESSYRSGYVNISPDNIGLGEVPNVATNDQAPTFTQATTLSNISSGEKITILFGKIQKWIADFIQHKSDNSHIKDTERTNWNAAKTHADSVHAPSNAEQNIQSDWNVTDMVSDAYIKNKPSSLPANGGSAERLSGAVQIADYDAFVPMKVAQGAMTPVKANADANSPWNNTTSGFLIQSNGIDSWHLLIFRSGGDGWAYRSYYQNVWNNWKIWSTFDGKYGSLSEKPTSFPPSTHTHPASMISGLSQVATTGKYSDLSGIPTSLPASDVSAWAKSASKPSYNWSEIDSRPTKLSEFENDSNFITLEDVNTSQNHTHSNKVALDSINQELIDNWNAASSHVGNKNNPHNVTASQIGAAPANHNHDNIYDKIKDSVTFTVPVSGWSSTAPYSQTISITGVKATDTPSLFPYTSKTLTPAQIKLSRKMFSCVTDAETANGSITLFCGEKKPTSDFEILAIGVSK